MGKRVQSTSSLPRGRFVYISCAAAVRAETATDGICTAWAPSRRCGQGAESQIVVPARTRVPLHKTTIFGSASSSGWPGQSQPDFATALIRREHHAIVELMRPSSNATVTFLPCTTGSENGSRLSSVMAGVAASDPARGWL
jgi:hypothetical protein